MKLTTALAALLILTPAVSLADGWGTITGQFVLEGDIPELDPLVKKGAANAKDPEVCAKDGVPNDTVIIDEESKGIANILLYPSRFKGDIHPEAAKRPDKVVFDQKGCQFIPHVMIVQTGQTVLIKSDDDCAHNARSTFVRNTAFNMTIPPNERDGVPYDVTAVEPVPMPINCDIHPYMTAYWLITDNPYAAVTDKDGKFEIKNVPEGDHTFKIWHEIAALKVGGSEYRRGLKVEVKDGETTDVGVIKIKVSDLMGK